MDHEVADLQIAEVREKRLGCRATPLRRTTLFLEDVGFGVDLQPRVGQPEAARQGANGDEQRRVSGVLGTLDRKRQDAVFLQQLDGPLGAPRSRRYEQRLVAILAEAPNLRDPVSHAPFELDGGLTADVLPRQRLPWLRLVDGGVVIQA